MASTDSRHTGSEGKAGDARPGACPKQDLPYRAFLDFLPYPVFVFNLDGTVSYLNPAFEGVFGWTFKEYEGRIIPFVPENLKRHTREGIERLFRDKVLNGFETQRLTKDGRLLDVVIDGAIFYDVHQRPAGQVVTFWDVTRQIRSDRIQHTLFRISRSLYQFRGLDQRLAFIGRNILNLLKVEGALVILVDEEKKEFFFRSAVYDNTDAEDRYRETRFPMDKGVTGEVYRTGKPMVVEDYYNSPFFFPMVDQETGAHTRNMIQVPMWTEDRMIGVLCAVNKKQGRFDQTDVDLLGTIAGIVALPIVNARINEALNRSYEEVKSINRAKDRVIHHLSHELKTPLSIIDASLRLLERKIAAGNVPDMGKIVSRCRRNLQRLLEMQYEIEDIMRGRNDALYPILTRVLESIIEAIESDSQLEGGAENIVAHLRGQIDALFGPRDAHLEPIALSPFVAEILEDLSSQTEHRRIEWVLRLDPARPVLMPVEVLKKIVIGLIRNAVENTPDGGRIEIAVADRAEDVQFTVRDYGVGMTPENRRMVFENYFTSHETMDYATGSPFDFNAGGKGFDLLRMKIFSERYHFKIHMETERCRFIPDEKDRCPGDVGFCVHCSSVKDCLNSGGTTVTVSFPVAGSGKEQAGSRGTASSASMGG